MANGFGNTLKQISDTFTSFVAEVREFIQRQTEFNSRLETKVDLLAKDIKLVQEQNARQQQALDFLVAELSEANGKIDLLVAELSRYKGDSGEMLLSIYAFCTIYGVPFSYGDLASMDRKATRESRRQGTTVQVTADPRFGTVNLYEPRILEDLFLSDED